MFMYRLDMNITYADEETYDDVSILIRLLYGLFLRTIVIKFAFQKTISIA